MKSAPRRAYRMVARAEGATVTGERILDAAVELFWRSPAEQISLEAVAQHAGVSTQTVIRRFGDKAALMAAAGARESERVSHQRDEAPVGDTVGAIRVLVEHYETFGDRVLKLLAEEQRLPALAEIVAQGRTVHRDWCARVFAAALARRTGAARSRLLAQVTAVCDVYTWKLLRRDAGLSRPQTELALVELLTPLVEGP